MLFIRPVRYWILNPNELTTINLYRYLPYDKLSKHW